MAEIRRALKCSREHLSKISGVRATVIKSVEFGRARLKYGLGQALCSHLNVSQVWLSLGLGTPTPQLPLAHSLDARIDRAMPFNAAFDQYIWANLSSPQKALYTAPADLGIKILVPVGMPQALSFQWMFLKEFSGILGSLPHAKIAAFWREISTSIDNFCAKHGLKRAVFGYMRPPNWPANKPLPTPTETMAHSNPSFEHSDLQSFLLTEPATYENLDAVRSPLKNLRARITAITSREGKLLELANYLKAPYTSVSRWVSGKREPGGETTLKMLRWVEQQERALKSPGR